MVAPAYHENSFVDHELSANLDSTFAFEGPEKLLEIWFWPSENDIPNFVNNEGLRCIPLEKWSEILDLVSCKILSMKSSSFMDAYLLSESSLFVFPHKLILKTCGTTTTLACLDKLFETINVQLGFNSKFKGSNIYKIFYSRRSFMFPEKQIHVHKDWKHEIQLLNDHFQNGKSYIVGDFTSDDHWYLYVGGQDETCKPTTTTTTTTDNHKHDQTFEILMTELNPECAKKFITSRKPGVASLIKSGIEEHDLGHDIGLETMEETGLDKVFELFHGGLPSPSNSDNMVFDEDDDESDDSPIPEPIKRQTKDKFEFIHDAFSFTPCGYSSNSVTSNEGGYYYTLHITPESGWSYASFETNYPFGNDKNGVDIIDVLLRILQIFEPKKFSMTLITEDVGDNQISFSKLKNSNSILQDHGYLKQERVMYDLKNEYKLLYLNFAKSKN
ncbi:S-adenosylmethionine decarboxylase [Scheffersomyces coipomensis]|uniref:S-adenosylmethionine decarboxylase n=1 Tax=Scheffersomyces coipomensis TaxID=1788519 RepID=UPI00315CFF46